MVEEYIYELLTRGEIDYNTEMKLDLLNSKLLKMNYEAVLWYDKTKVYLLDRNLLSEFFRRNGYYFKEIVLIIAFKKKVDFKNLKNDVSEINKILEVDESSLLSTEIVYDYNRIRKYKELYNHLLENEWIFIKEEEVFFSNKFLVQCEDFLFHYKIIKKCTICNLGVFNKPIHNFCKERNDL